MLIKLIVEIVIGAVVGFIAGKIMETKDNGFVVNAILGIIGGFIGNLLGIGGGWITGTILAVVGACLVIFVLRKVMKN
ncbi:MAG: GlsB/YeaQ/YmgE family stress response membrane protein [Oscillospiraceae bacterium]|nr:GlsB/YeaQ/YmgE family stress response membrane protein [Oscillospiraceae bacterium]